MQFQRLRLSGFKSFVEPTEFRIEPGLTGIVGQERALGQVGGRVQVRHGRRG